MNESMPRQSAQKLEQFIGSEHGLDEVSRALCFFAREIQAPVVGALHLTCSDESERECVDSFQHAFVQYLLPELKFAQQSAFRTANLGARYEWGSLPITEEHFATPESRKSFKLVVAKINSHAAVEPGDDTVRFGRRDRYQNDSAYCGALDALLKGDSPLPFMQDLREVFGSEGKDRVASLRDPQKVKPAYRGLFAAVVNARLQARRAVLDIQEHPSRSPTLYLVIPCVTLNRRERDTEIVCGIYLLDQRQPEPIEEYTGLGDDPALYELREQHGRLVLEDEHVTVRRAARNHRELALHAWRQRQPAKCPQDARLEQIRQELTLKKHHDELVAKAMLQQLLVVLADLTPVTAAMIAFGHGLTGIHHVYRVHRLAYALADDGEAQRILAEVRSRIDSLPHDRARDLIEHLAQQV